MINFLIGTLFTIGICLAMNEGEWFPWVNMLGVVMIGLVGILTTPKGDSHGS